MNWWRDGGPANSIYGGGYGLFARNTGVNQLWRYTGSPMSWQLIDDDAVFAENYVVTNDSIYKQKYDGVYEYTGLSLSWIKIGDPAKKIYGGGTTLLATDITTGAVYRYNGSPGSWGPIGGPGADFCVNDVAIYARSPVGSANEGVYRYDGSGTSWTRIGDPAQSIACGGSRLIATDRTNGDVYLYGGTPGGWGRIGGPGNQFVVAGDNTIYGRNIRGVWEWSGSGTSWWQIGDWAPNIVAAS
jgi:hypothetical protein